MSALLAKVLNSTVGTSSFKALDKVLEDTLIRNRAFAATDEPYYTFPSSLQEWSGNNLVTAKSLITFSMPYDGSAKLKFAFGPQFANNTGYFYIYVNGVQQKMIINNSAYNATTLQSEIFRFSKGDVIDIQVQLTNAEAYMRVFLDSITASIVESSTPTNITLKV